MREPVVLPINQLLDPPVPIAPGDYWAEVDLSTNTVTLVPINDDEEIS